MSLESAYILFVDDDQNQLKTFQRTLRDENYTVLTASSAEQAADQLTNHPVDIIVTDNQMPGMKGTELLAAVRREYPTVARILLTGDASLDVALQAINVSHVDHLFIKPVNWVDLAISIRELLAQKVEKAKSNDNLLDSAKLLRRLERTVSHTDKSQQDS